MRDEWNIPDFHPIPVPKPEEPKEDKLCPMDRIITVLIPLGLLTALLMEWLI